MHNVRSRVIGKERTGRALQRRDVWRRGFAARGDVVSGTIRHQRRPVCAVFNVTTPGSTGSSGWWPQGSPGRSRIRVCSGDANETPSLPPCPLPPRDSSQFRSLGVPVPFPLEPRCDTIAAPGLSPRGAPWATEGDHLTRCSSSDCEGGRKRIASFRKVALVSGSGLYDMSSCAAGR